MSSIHWLMPLALLTVSLPAQAGPAGVTICHKTSSSVLTISVSPSAVSSHLAHGDTYPLPWYADADGDGHGDPLVSTTACVAPAGTVGVGDDPDDTDPTVYPGAPDVCDGVDNDGDASFDEDSLEGMVLLARIGSDLVAIDPVSGAEEVLVALTSAEIDVTGLNTITSDLVTGETFGVDKNTDQLVHIDTCTGEVTVIGFVGEGNYCGASLGPDGELWALDALNDNLVTLDPATGAQTVVGWLGFNLGNCGLAHDCATDDLFGLHTVASDKSDDYVFSLDAATGLGSKLISLDRSKPSVWNQAGLEVDVEAGVYYVGTATGVYEVDAVTGDAVLLAEGSVDNLGWYNPATCD